MIVLKNLTLVGAGLMLLVAVLDSPAQSAEMRYLRPKTRRAPQYNWHANYAHSEYGQPVALVVPPTAQMQTNWSWGAPSAHFSRIDHQFGRNYSYAGSQGAGFQRTPQWPSDMRQFGVHHVRGPWYPTQR
jgi:hypothetical protein